MRATWLRGLALAMLLFVTRARAESPPDGIALAQRLGTTSRPAVERAVADIEHAPADTRYLEEALREAARACEDVLADPARALALYDRMLAEFPDGGAARIARGRAQVLRARIGDGHAREAAELAALAAPDLTLTEVVRRAEVLIARPWPGAPDAAIFLAAALARHGRLAEAQRRYAAVEARWPGTAHAVTARWGGAHVAIAAHDWPRAERVTRSLPTDTVADRVLRDALLQRIERGRWFDIGYRASWLLLIGCVIGLLASLVEAGVRGGWRALSWKPPLEIVFLLPISAVLVGVALTTHERIAPAVLAISVGGVALAWLSGATLEVLRVNRRPMRLRIVLNVLLCLVAVAAFGYLVLTHDDLIEMVIETVQFAPE